MLSFLSPRNLFFAIIPALLIGFGSFKYLSWKRNKEVPTYSSTVPASLKEWTNELSGSYDVEAVDEISKQFDLAIPELKTYISKLGSRLQANDPTAVTAAFRISEIIQKVKTKAQPIIPEFMSTLVHIKNRQLVDFASDSISSTGVDLVKNAMDFLKDDGSRFLGLSLLKNNLNKISTNVDLVWNLRQDKSLENRLLVYKIILNVQPKLLDPKTEQEKLFGLFNELDSKSRCDLIKISSQMNTSIIPGNLEKVLKLLADKDICEKKYSRKTKIPVNNDYFKTNLAGQFRDYYLSLELSAENVPQFIQKATRAIRSEKLRQPAGYQPYLLLEYLQTRMRLFPSEEIIKTLATFSDLSTKRSRFENLPLIDTVLFLLQRKLDGLDSIMLKIIRNMEPEEILQNCETFNHARYYPTLQPVALQQFNKMIDYISIINRKLIAFNRYSTESTNEYLCAFDYINQMSNLPQDTQNKIELLNPFMKNGISQNGQLPLDDIIQIGFPAKKLSSRLAAYLEGQLNLVQKRKAFMALSSVCRNGDCEADYFSSDGKNRVTRKVDFGYFLEKSNKFKYEMTYKDDLLEAKYLLKSFMFLSKTYPEALSYLVSQIDSYENHDGDVEKFLSDYYEDVKKGH